LTEEGKTGDSERKSSRYEVRQKQRALRYGHKSQQQPHRMAHQMVTALGVRSSRNWIR